MSSVDFCYNCFAEIDGDKCGVCGYVNAKCDNYTALSPGYVLNKTYKIGRILGTGGFGITYKACNIKTNEIVAIKEYVPMNIVYRDDDGELQLKASIYKEPFEDGLNSFINEASFLVIFKNSENIVNIYDCFNLNNTAYIVMEFLEGDTLNIIKRADYRIILDYILKAGEALKVIHSKGIVHRDISPHNIFKLKNGDIKIIDFGNARYFNKGNDNDDKLVLKPGFSPPELYMKENVQGPWTDIYSLAATFYTLVTGLKLPSAIERIDGAPVVSIKNYVPDIEFSIYSAVNRALETDYYNRQKSIDEFVNEIKNPVYNHTVVTENLAENTEQVSVNNVIKNKKRESKVSIFKRHSGKEKKIRNNNRAEVISRYNTVRYDEIKEENIIRERKAYIQAYDGRMYIVNDGREVVIGRNARMSHIFIDNVQISRKHCVVRYSSAKEEFYIVDWSTNGVFLKGDRRLEYGVTYKLMPGEDFYLSLPKYCFKVVLKDG